MEHLTKDELKSLLEVARKRCERDWLMVLVAFSHGLRASEVTNLTARNIQDGYIVVQRLKGSLKTKQKLVTSTDPLLSEASALQAFAKARPVGKLFPVSRQWFWRIVQDCGKAAGLPAHKQHPHVLKHTCAMLSIQGAGIENVRQYLGHKSIASTGAYLKVDDEQACAAFAAAAGL